MQTDYELTGWFYVIDNLRFRRFLDIKRNGCDDCLNDLTVVMMNPGSSKPKEDKKSNWSDKPVEAHSDPTICQICKVMDNCGLNYARIINLSDYRSPNSGDFCKQLRNRLQEYDHSIFSEPRRDNLKNSLNPNSVFIYAWGVNPRLSGLAKQALDAIEKIFGDVKKVGLKHRSNTNGYYHPLPRTHVKQQEWVECIITQIDNVENKT